MKHTDSGITGRFLEAWHRLEIKEGRRVKLARFGELLGKTAGTGPVSASTVGRWERGAIPDLVTAVVIAKTCGVNTVWFVLGIGSPDDPEFGEVSILPGSAEPKPKRGLVAPAHGERLPRSGTGIGKKRKGGSR